ncbi:MAG TPA: tetratricopeptide repeat protein [Puia sp.]|nr:tetratricopeptide repeat protein [Puia sp.]
MKRVFLLFLTLVLCLPFAFSQVGDSSVIFFQKALDEKNKRLFMVAYNDFQRSLQFRSDNVDAQRELGLTAVELRKYENARMAFLKVNELKKDDPVAIENLANLYFWTRQWKEAIVFAEKAQQLNVGKNWNYMLGKCYNELEDFGKASRYLQAAAKEDSANAEIPYLIARGFVDMNNYKSAIPFFKRAIFLDSSKNRWIYECALTYATILDDRSAIQYYQLAASKGYKTDNDFYEYLSDSYVASGQMQKGLDIMLKLLEKKPADPDLLYSIAHSYYRMGKYDQAIDYWDRVLSLDKENARSLYMIGMAYQKKGDTGKGKQLCDKAIQMDPSLKNLKQEKRIVM